MSSPLQRGALQRFGRRLARDGRQAALASESSMSSESSIRVIHVVRVAASPAMAGKRPRRPKPPCCPSHPCPSHPCRPSHLHGLACAHARTRTHTHTHTRTHTGCPTHQRAHARRTRRRTRVGTRARSRAAASGLRGADCAPPRRRWNDPDVQTPDSFAFFSLSLFCVFIRRKPRRLVRQTEGPLQRAAEAQTSSNSLRDPASARRPPLFPALSLLARLRPLPLLPALLLPSRSLLSRLRLMPPPPPPTPPPPPP